MRIYIPEIIIHTFTIANILIFALVSVLFARKYKVSKAHLRFFFVLILSSLWILDVYLEWYARNLEIYRVIVYFNYLIAMAVASTVASFAIHFPRVNIKFNSLKEFIFFIPAIIAGILSFTKLVVNIVDLRTYDLTNNANGYLLYLAILMFYFCIITPTFFIKKIFKSTGIQRVQLKYITTGYLISVSILVTQSIITNFKGVIPVSVDFIFTNTSMIFVLLTAYAMLRYRFMDYRIVFKKGFIYVISLALSLGIYTYIVLFLRNYIESSWNTNAGWTAALLIFITVVGFIPIKIVVEKLISKLFKGRKSIDLAVAELKKDISEQSDAASLAKLLTAQVRRFLDVSEAHVYLGKPSEELVSYGNGGDRISRENDIVRYFQKYRDPIVREEIPHMLDEREGEFERDALQKVEKEMKKQKLSIAMPFVHEDGLFGLLTVGERESKEAFTVQDIQFLTKLREEIGFTLASALQYSYAMERIKRMQAAGEL